MNKLTSDSLFSLNSNYFVGDEKEKFKQFMENQKEKKFKFDISAVLLALNKTSKSSQLCIEIADFNQKYLIQMVGQKIIKECEVYLYLKDPFLTIETFKKN